MASHLSIQQLENKSSEMILGNVLLNEILFFWILYIFTLKFAIESVPILFQIAFKYAFGYDKDRCWLKYITLL